MPEITFTQDGLPPYTVHVDDVDSGYAEGVIASAAESGWVAHKPDATPDEQAAPPVGDPIRLDLEPAPEAATTDPAEPVNEQPPGQLDNTKEN